MLLLIPPTAVLPLMVLACAPQAVFPFFDATDEPYDP